MGKKKSNVSFDKNKCLGCKYLDAYTEQKSGVNLCLKHRILMGGGLSQKLKTVIANCTENDFGSYR
mgnify:CR=1 FL=1